MLALSRRTLVITLSTQKWLFTTRRQLWTPFQLQRQCRLTARQCRISNAANVAYATGLALLGASQHPVKNFPRHSRVFPRSVGKPSKAYLACVPCVNLLCRLRCYNIYQYSCNNHLHKCKMQLFTELIICTTTLLFWKGPLKLNLLRATHLLNPALQPGREGGSRQKFGSGGSINIGYFPNKNTSKASIANTTQACVVSWKKENTQYIARGNQRPIKKFGVGEGVTAMHQPIVICRKCT